MQNKQDTVYTTYIVKRGDSLFSIAQLFDSSVEMIKKFNNLVTDTIYPNQVLFIPKKYTQESNSYQTVEGDTLATVFRKLNLDTMCLKNYIPMMDILLVPNQFIELVDFKGCQNKTITYMGENIEEFLMNNEINAIDLLKLNKNKWLTSGSRVKIS